IALHVRLRPDAQHDDVLARHGRAQRLAHPLGERHDEQEDGHDERDAQDGHDGRGLAHDQVAEVVLQRDEHQATSLRPSTIFTRAERMAGTNPATIPMATEAAKAVRSVAAEMWML